MSDLTVIHDPNLEIAAIVDMDTNQGWGPICVGPQSAELLQAFVDGMPFDITMLTPEQATNIFVAAFHDTVAESVQDAPAPVGSAVEQTSDPVADAAASGNTGPVDTTSAANPVAPSDADMEANTGQTNQVTPDPTAGTAQVTEQPNAGVTAASDSAAANCLVCNANGQGSTNPSCVVCGGTGKVAA